MSSEEVIEGFAGAVVAGGLAEFADDEAAEEETAAFDVFGVDAVVADEGVGHGDDLTVVGGIRKDFLVAGHAGVEHHFAIDFPVSTEGLA
ncbi:MAG: hypothetical protein RL215_750 [Planctomycetota bacterium]